MTDPYVRQLKTNLIHLEQAGTPRSSLTASTSADLEFINATTTGDEFIRLAEETLDRIRSLPEPIEFFERIFVGPFGSGKTHMALLLYHRLKSDPNQLLITFDFSNLNGDPALVEYLIVTGMRTQGRGYQQAFQHIFNRIVERLHPNIVEKNTNIGKALLYRLYLFITRSQEGWPQIAGDLVERNFGDEIKAALRDGTLNHLIGQYQQQTSHEFSTFVEALADLVANPEAYGGQFEQKLRELSAKGVLYDIVFKLIKAAGYTRVVMIGDELEALAADPGSVAKVLTHLRVLRDHYVILNYQQGHPATALILFSSDAFLETFSIAEPALLSRWQVHLVYLPKPDVEQTVEKFTEIALRADYIQQPADSAEIVQIITESQDPDKPSPTMRELIHLILRLLRTRYGGKK